MRLTKGMYGTEFRNTDCPLFGIKCGQMRGNQITHNSGWYNQLGEKLGWGDLSPEDFQRISEELENDELFIILSEQDSFWKPARSNSILGRWRANPDVEAPGINYVLKHAIYIIAPRRCYSIDRCGGLPPDDFVRNGINFRVLTPRAAAKLIIAAIRSIKSS